MTKSTEDRLADVEAVLEQMLKPLKSVPFRVIVRSLAEREVIPIDLGNPDDIKLLETLKRAIYKAGEAVRTNPIERSRPNEVGNDIEVFVKKALAEQGLRVEAPTAFNGKTKGVGYPDILVFDSLNRPTYIECKTYSADTANSSMRSFYLSPSESFKVSKDARHLVLSYEMVRTPAQKAGHFLYTPVAFKLVDVSDLLCDVKYEFNSDNRRLYDRSLILIEDTI